MKKLLFILAGGIALSAHGQTLSEDFSNGIPSTWTVTDVDGQTPAAQVSFVNNAWVTDQATDGNTYAVSTSWYNPAGTADDWLITPSITISSTETYLIWKAGAPDQNFPDGYEVRMSTTGTATSDFTTVLYTNTGEDAPFVTRSLSLGSYNGQTVHLAFRNNSNDQFLLFVDDVVVDVFNSLDAEATALNMNRVIKTGTTVNIDASFFNHGKAFDAADFNYQINSGPVVTQSLTGLNLSPLGTLELTHNQAWTPSADGTYTLKVWLSNLDGNPDDEPANDVLTENLFVTSNPPERNVVIEEKTGTWCGWCPRGTVGMDYMSKTYPGTAITIAVHNGDPMVVTGYDGNSFIGLVAPGGYPGSSVDRVLGPDPNSVALENAYNERRDVAPAADVKINTVTYDASSGSLDVAMSAEFFADLNNLDYRFALVIMEDGVKGASSGYAQVNYYSSTSQNIALVGAGKDWQAAANPVPASEMTYDHTARAIEPSFFGEASSVPTSVTSGQTVNHTISTTLPSSVINDDHVHLVVMLLDNDTYEVVNAVKRKLTNGIGIREFGDVSAKVYPNPAVDRFFIETEADNEDVAVSIVNAIGQTVMEGTYSSNDRIEINTSAYDKGVYILNVTIDGKTQSQSLIISE